RRRRLRSGSPGSSCDRRTAPHPRRPVTTAARSVVVRGYSLRRVLTPDDLRALDLWWRAANYLSVGQIYLLDNPLLLEPLQPEHVKPRLLGHWGTTPGLNLIYAHVSRLIRRDGFEAIFLAGPGHGGPGLVASTWLEGSYSERYPDISLDEEGMR